MLRHYLTITRRLITRHKGYFLINISGFILGLAAVLLAFVYIADETAYDRFHLKGDRIFRVNKWVTDNTGDRYKTAESPGRMAPTLEEDFPEVEEAVRFAPWFDEVLLSYQDQSNSTTGFAFAEPDFFELFDFRMVRGTPKEALKVPGQLVLTPALAESLFGDEDPIGKAVTGLNDQRFTVSGIVEAPPRHSHLQFDALASWSTTDPSANLLNFSFMNNWLGQTVYTYVLLKSKELADTFNEKMPEFVSRYMANRTDMYDFYLQPLGEVYLQSHDIRYLRGNKYGSAPFLKTFSIIALLILLIACFNYINISTARSLQRAKEVGMKKVMGAGRRQLLEQFLVETLVIIALAGGFALLLSHHLLPWFNENFQRDIPVANLLDYPTLLFLVGIILLTGLAAGLFPGWLLSGLRPIRALRARGKDSPGGERPRQVLTALQLTLSVGLIAGTILINQQFSFLLHRDLGFDKEQVLVMPTPPGIEKNSTAFRNTLLDNPDIQNVSICQAAIGSGTFGTTLLPPRGQGNEITIQAFRVDTQFLDTYGIELLDGRFLSVAYPDDTSYNSVVVNEELLRVMGWQDADGKQIHFGEDDPGTPVVGVVKDFHFNSLHQPIGPAVMWLDPRKSNISVRFESDKTAETLTFLQETWQNFESRYPFDFFFVDEFFAKSYTSEKQMLKTITLFSIIAIFIACLGLYGLAAFSVSRRRKEIGIRKVLGASVRSIVLMLNKQLLLLSAIAFILGAALSWYFFSRWLEQYAYTIDIRAWVFLLAGGITMGVAAMAVLLQSLRAARANPADSLKYE